MSYLDISTPYVYLDLDKVESNITAMVSRLKKYNIAHRPHIKAHKSIYLAKKQIELGAIGVTCAKFSEAEIMAAGGIDNILIAFPIIGEKNLNRLKSLSFKANITTIVDSYYVAEGLSKVGEEINKKIKILIEMDGGSHRGGVQPGKPTLDFVQEISQLSGIEIAGLMAYVGQIYNYSARDQMRDVSKMEADYLLQTKELLEQNGYPVPITSGGSTPSSFFAEELQGISESRAGNYIFFDMNAVNLGIAEVQDCSLKIVSTVVSIPLPGYATIDAGSKTLTSDLSVKGNTHGYILGKPDVEIVKLNEEHGYLRFDPEKYHFSIGDKLEIIPNHSCVIPNLADKIYGFRDGNFVQEISIDARGKNY